MMRPRAGMVLALLVSCAPAIAAPSAAALEAARRGVVYLREEMDAYHDRFPVYDDVSAAGNHFHALGKIPDETALVTSNGSWTENPHGGATSIRCEFQSAGTNFGGFYFLNGILPAGQAAPVLNFGDVPDAGIDLRGARALTFWVRGASDGLKVEFFLGGVGWSGETRMQPYPDSTPRVS